MQIYIIYLIFQKEIPYFVKGNPYTLFIIYNIV